MKTFLENENRKLAALYKDCSHALWMVSTTGEKKWQEKEVKAEQALREYLSDPKRFATIQEGLVKAEPGSLEHRQFQRLYQEAAPNQIKKEWLMKQVQLASELSNRFNTFRAKVDGQTITENQVREILLQSTDMEQRRKVWRASKAIGKEVEKGLLELVKLRNEAAQSLGYEDFHEMSFALNELDRTEIFRLFDELQRQTEAAFQEVKQEIDAELREKYRISDEKLKPWHYTDPFFQEAPPVAGTDLTPFLQDNSLEKLTADTFSALGMEIKDLLAKSDLYERPGKNQHAFCIDMDRHGDVRVLCNLKKNQYWMETMLHEFGHAVYDKYIDRRLPFLLRAYAHIFTTEAVAMFFGRMVRNREWLEHFIGFDTSQLEEWMPSVERMSRRKMLVMARWIITFVKFEKELYTNPDQDLNALWWQLVNEIQHVEPPSDVSQPDWAAKIHFTIAPIYYQNYLLGELLASQFVHYLKKQTLSSFFSEETGRFFMEKIFFPGDRYGWQRLVQDATGEPLQPHYFVAEFVGSQA